MATSCLLLLAPLPGSSCSSCQGATQIGNDLNPGHPTLTRSVEPPVGVLSLLLLVSLPLRHDRLDYDCDQERIYQDASQVSA